MQSSTDENMTFESALEFLDRSLTEAQASAELAQAKAKEVQTKALAMRESEQVEPTGPQANIEELRAQVEEARVKVEEAQADARAKVEEAQAEARAKIEEAQAKADEKVDVEKAEKKTALANLTRSYDLALQSALVKYSYLLQDYIFEIGMLNAGSIIELYETRADLDFPKATSPEQGEQRKEAWRRHLVSDQVPDKLLQCLGDGDGEMPEDQADVWGNFAANLFVRRDSDHQVEVDRPGRDGKLYIYIPAIVADEELKFLGCLVKTIKEDVILISPPLLDTEVEKPLSAHSNSGAI